MASDPIFGPCYSLFNFLLRAALYGVALSGVLTILIVFVLFGLTGFLYIKFRVLSGKPKRSQDDPVVIGFFHPYCNAGGGGERVLWVAIRALQKRFENVKCLVYTGDIDAAPYQILDKAEKRFNIGQLERSGIEFVYLHRRKWVEAEMWPMFTLLGQSLGSVFLGIEALNKANPDIFLDTMGYAFTLPLFKFLGDCKVGCYVHYPTISTDMLAKVKSRKSGFNNRGFIAKSGLATAVKLVYYKFFAWLYGLAGSTANVVMVNSSWTEDHIQALWRSEVLRKVFPPCDIEEFRRIPREDNLESTQRIISLGQFRPEKDHPLQIRALARVRDLINEDKGLSQEQKDKKWENIRLVLIGGCRNAEDESRVRDLKDLCRHLSVDGNVEFKVNLNFQDLKREISRAKVGIHTMWNEHFGIAVVEMMASGLVTLAHRSGGPLMDIVTETSEGRTGFLAVHDDEYAESLLEILESSDEFINALRSRAKDSVQRFSEKEFEISWLRATETVVNSCMTEKRSSR